VAGLEAARARRGFHDSLLREGPPQANERYTARLQALKKHARAAISLTPRTRRPSNVLADLVGMFVAAVAMAFATFTVYWAQKQGPQFGERESWKFFFFFFFLRKRKKKKKTHFSLCPS